MVLPKAITSGPGCRWSPISNRRSCMPDTERGEGSECGVLRVTEISETSAATSSTLDKGTSTPLAGPYHHHYQIIPMQERGEEATGCMRRRISGTEQARTTTPRQTRPSVYLVQGVCVCVGAACPPVGQERVNVPAREPPPPNPSTHPSIMGEEKTKEGGEG